jgi:DNA-binding GntR family transcriptional regulator
VAKNLTRLTLREQAEEVLREMIASYRFTPGKWINVERLAKDLGVSRTPVWQALKNLEMEGLVEHVPKRGMRMAPMNLEMAYDLYAVRESLEGLAARLATEKINGKAVTRLESLLKKQHQIVQLQDVVAYSKLDFEFHGVIYDYCGNWLLRELLENIKARARPFVCDITPILPALYQDHVDVIEAFKNRDSAGAKKAICKHNARMRTQIERTHKKE